MYLYMIVTYTVAFVRGPDRGAAPFPFSFVVDVTWTHFAFPFPA